MQLINLMIFKMTTTELRKLLEEELLNAYSDSDEEKAAEVADKIVERLDEEGFFDQEEERLNPKDLDYL